MKILKLLAVAGLLTAPAVAAPIVSTAATVAVVVEPQVTRTTVVRNRNGRVVRTTNTRNYGTPRRYDRGSRTVCTTRYRGGERRRTCRRVRR